MAHVSKRQLLDALFNPTPASAGFKWLVDHGFVPLSLYGGYVQSETELAVWAYPVDRGACMYVLVGYGGDSCWTACTQDRTGACGDWHDGGTPAKALAALDRESPLADMLGWTGTTGTEG